jgi:hypothetical protein
LFFRAHTLRAQRTGATLRGAKVIAPAVVFAVAVARARRLSAGTSQLVTRRILLGQAANIANRFDPYCKSFYKRLAKKKPKAVAKTAPARKLLLKLSLMLRDQITAQEFAERGRTLDDARRVQGLK